MGHSKSFMNFSTQVDIKKQNRKMYPCSNDEVEIKDNDITSLEHLLSVLILKYFSSKEHPLNAKAIADYMSMITGHEHTEKTISRKLQNKYLTTGSVNNDRNPADESTFELQQELSLVFNGRILCKESNNPKKNHRSFYFEPFLNNSDLDMICGSITSNRYLNENEKNYLITCERCLSPYSTSKTRKQHYVCDSKCSLPSLPKRPYVSVKSTDMEHKMLQHVNQLYEAINKQYQISLTYGTYDKKAPCQRQLILNKKSKAYTLNPYFMLWNNGHYFLIATHKGHSNPAHFRIDRIVSIETVYYPDDALTPVQREETPECFNAFTRTQNGKRYFVPTKYTSTYPLMGIFNEANVITKCCIECTTATLPILVDTFGDKIAIAPSTICHDVSEVDIHGNSQNFFIAIIQNVQYDNMLLFCQQQHATITVISPPELVNDIYTKLSSSLAKYDKYRSQSPADST